MLGGTGHLGNAFTRLLLDEGHDVTIGCRRDVARANLEGLDVATLAGDDRRRGQMDRWLRGHDLVIDAAAPYPIRLFDRDKSRKDLEREALDRCRRLIDALQKREAELVYISSFTTLPMQPSWQARLQSAMIRGSHPYFEIKAAIERQIIASAGQGLRAVVINPTVCLGPWDAKPTKSCFVAAVARGDLLGVTQQTMNIIDVRDVAELGLKALAAKEFGRPIALSGHDIELASLVREICRLAGRRPPEIRTSSRLAAVGAYWTDVMFGAFGQSSPVPSLPFLLLCECRAMSPSPVQQKLDHQPRPLETTLKDALGWYRQVGYW